MTVSAASGSGVGGAPGGAGGGVGAGAAGGCALQAPTAAAPVTVADVTRNARRVQLSCAPLILSASCRFAPVVLPEDRPSARSRRAERYSIGSSVVDRPIRTNSTKRAEAA